MRQFWHRTRLEAKCFPCLSLSHSNKMKGSSRCWSNSSTYSIACLTCKSGGQTAQYWGESGHNSYTRGKSHWEGLVSRRRDNVLHQHAVKHHGGQQHQLGIDDFHMEVIESHRSNLSRQIHEGQLISHQLGLRDKEMRQGLGQPRMILNSKKEFNQPGLIAPRVTKILY